MIEFAHNLMHDEATFLWTMATSAILLIIVIMPPNYRTWKAFK